MFVMALRDGPEEVAECFQFALPMLAMYPR